MCSWLESTVSLVLEAPGSRGGVGRVNYCFLGPFCTLQNNFQLNTTFTSSKNKSAWKADLAAFRNQKTRYREEGDLPQADLQSLCGPTKIPAKFSRKLTSRS